MDNKENNQDDLVVSSTGEMLTKEESEQRTIEVKEAPKQESVSDTPATETTSPPSDTTPKPSGLAPPDLPTPPPTETPSDTPATKQSALEPEASADSEKSNKQPTPNSEMSDEAFAKRHSNQQRGVASHPTRNNKKVLAALIVFSAVALCAIAVYVYLSTQENVVEVETTPNQSQQQETTEPIDTSEDELPIDGGAAEETIDDSLPVDETQVQEDTSTPSDPVEEPIEEPSASPQTSPLN